MSTKFKFENLDSIRTIAFFSTFLAHAFYTESEIVLNSVIYKKIIGISHIFGFGVPIFFVLSGFLITYLMLKEQEENQKFNLKNFYIRRVLRIWPVYYIVIFIGFVVFPIFRNYFLHLPYLETANPLYYVLFLSNFDQINQGVLPFGVGLGPTWSVGVEEQFYLFWPVLILFFKKLKFITPILISIFFSIVLSLLFNLSSKHTVFCMIYLSVGALYAYLAYYKTAFIKTLVNISHWLFILSVLLVFFTMYISSIGYGNFWLIIFIAFSIGYIIVFQCYSGKMQLKKIPFLESLGKYTYGLYLYHVVCNFISHVFIDDILKMPETKTSVLVIKPLLSLSLSIILSYISYHYYERFFLNLKAKYAGHK